MTTSKRIGEIAAKAADLKKKGDITVEEIRELGASALSQRQDVSTRPPHPSRRRTKKESLFRSK